MGQATAARARAERSANRGYLRALPLANLVLIATSVYSSGWLLFAILNNKPQWYLKVGFAALAAASAIVLRLNPAIRLTAMSLLVGAGAGVYATELLALGLHDPDRSFREAVRQAAKQDGTPYDARTKLEVVMELRARQVPAYPPFYPHRTLDRLLQAGGEPVIPLTSLPGVTTVCCNEGGQYLIYKTDERGFANPPGLWGQAPIDIALVGSSIAVGECVPPADSIAARLRERYPKTISLGGGGNGPLLELASMQEYLPALRPRRVLWVFGESHAARYLERESRVPMLRRYLEAGFQQGLLGKQEAVDQAIRKYLEGAIEAELRPARLSWRERTMAWLRLKQVRQLVSDFRERSSAVRRARFEAGMYERVLRRGQQIAGGWGGQITVLYVPDAARYPGAPGYSPELRRAYDETRAEVLKAAGRLGMPVIDISQRFEDLPASRAAEYAKYFYPHPAHFKPLGYRVMDAAILEELR